MSRRVEESSTWMPSSSRSRASRFVVALSMALAATITLAPSCRRTMAAASLTVPSNGMPAAGYGSVTLSSTNPRTR